MLRAYRALAPLLACSPVNAAEEHHRLTEAWKRGAHAKPAWQYAPPNVANGRRALVRAERAALSLGTHPLRACYEARLAELSTEFTLVEHAGTPELAPIAARRFPITTGLEATALRWASLPSASDAGESDGSIAAQVRQLIGRLRLPFRVEETTRISALAATGEDVIYVASHRLVSKHVAKRTAVHEVYGHALPRTLAARQALAIFRFGTAQGHDDQEGYALACEEEHGLFDDDRKREIAMRWLVARDMQQGASFVSVMKSLVARAIPVERALRLSSRVFRGSGGESPGAGRESSYLEGYRRVVRTAPTLRRVIARGQVACAWASALAPFVNYIDS